MKLALIVQRYGKEILGGSETLARQLAERLSRRHDITVLTTTAQDYITWKNEYPPGEDKLRGVRVRRFPVEGERDIEDFNRFSEELYQGNPTREQELEWLERQGPVAPELIEYLKKEHERFDLLVFFTYLYYPTYYGLQIVPDKSILIPTAHDEPPLRFGIFKEMFQLPDSFIFNTEAEEVLVLERFPVHKKMRETIGMGMELLDQPDASAFRKKHEIPGKYLLYAGRIDGGKGLEELFRYFTFYKEEHPASGNLELILIGKLGMKLPDDESIRYIGFVDEADKLSAMAGAVAVMQPSQMESLSIVTLEAFSVGTPVIANAASRVLVEHCRRANAGFYYRDFEEFEEILSLLLSDKSLGRTLGRNGQRYIKENYGWSKLLAKYELAFRASARPSREPKAARPRPSPPARPRRREVEARPAEPRPAEPRPERGAPAVERAETKPPVEGAEAEPPAETLPEERAGEEEREEKREEVAEEAPEEVAEEAPEEVDEDLAHLPSFYRSSLPARKSGEAPIEPRAKVALDEPADREETEAPAEEPEPEEPVEESAEEPGEEKPSGEFELPDFYKPRPGPEPGQAESSESEAENNGDEEKSSIAGQ